MPYHSTVVPHVGNNGAQKENDFPQRVLQVDKKKLDCLEYHQAFELQVLPHSKQLGVKNPPMYLPTSLPIQVWFPTDVLQH